MKNEVYLWVALVVVILAAALFFRYFYQSQMSLVLGLSSQQSQLYPYQKATFTIDAFNNGTSAITNMSIGVQVNGNLTTLYKVTLPAGKQASIAYNYSPESPGTYKITALADPGMLYNMADRSKLQANRTLIVLVPQNAMPGQMLPKENITTSQSSTLSGGGFIVATYLNGQYGISRFALTDSKDVSKLLNPIFNLTSPYVKNMSLASAKYSDGSSAYSLWMKSFIAPNIFGVQASALKFNWTNSSSSEGTVTVIRLSNTTTFCSWYSGGWMKMLAYSGSRSCFSIVNASAPNATSSLPSGNIPVFYDRLAIPNSTLLGNYTGISGPGGAYAAKLALFSNSSFVYAGIANSTPQTNLCYGLISTANGTSYCSTYLLPKSGNVSALSLVRTTSYLGTYNLTVFSLVNTSYALAQIPVAVDLMKGFNMSGTPVEFMSGIVNTCAFTSSFPCTNTGYSNGTISFTITNNAGSAIKLNSFKCYTFGAALGPKLNTTLQNGESANVSTGCYDSSGRISTVSLGLKLHLEMNYTIGNETRNQVGNAFIPFAK